MDKFNVLLQNISRALHPNDLEDLVHICCVDESRKATITSGHHLFTYLRHNRRISEENVDNLKQILNAIHRNDLVSIVERFEGLETTPSIADQISTASSETNKCLKDDSCRIEIGRKGTNQIPCCIVQWPCLQMSCYKIHLCYVILTVIFILAIIAIALCWYADVPNISEHLKSETSVHNAGLFAIIALILIFPIFMLVVFFVRKHRKRRQDNAALFSTANTRTSTQIILADVGNTEDRLLAVGPQTSPNCEEEMSDKPKTSGSFVRNIITTGDMEPILFQESES